MNLLAETIKGIFDSGHTPDDVVFIGSAKSGHECSWGEFQHLADVEYDEGFGGAEVARDLIVVFGDGHTMWRGEYDGSEWWQYSTPFVRPAMPHRIYGLVRLPYEYQDGLAEISDAHRDHDTATNRAITSPGTVMP